MQQMREGNRDETPTSTCILVSRSTSSMYPDQVVAQTASVNILLGYHAGGGIYNYMHPFRTFVAYYKWRKKLFNCRKETAQIRYLYFLADSKYFRRQKVSACWSRKDFKSLSAIPCTLRLPVRFCINNTRDD